MSRNGNYGGGGPGGNRDRDVRGRGRSNGYGYGGGNSGNFNGNGNGRQGQGPYNQGRGRAVDGTVTYQRQNFTLQNEITPATEENKNLGQRGWKIEELPNEKENFVLPKRIDGDKNLRATSRTISIKTNHFPVKVTLPPIFYQYEVELIRKEEEKVVCSGPGSGDSNSDEVVRPRSKSKLPKDLRRRILQKAVEQMTDESPGTGIITDFGVEVWSTEKLENNIPFEFEVNLEGIANYEEEFEGTGSFTVKLRQTEGAIDTGPLQLVINNMRGHDQEQLIIEVKKVYNTLLKNLANSNYTITGRSNLIRRPPQGQDGNSLGQGLVCWDGLSTLFEMGWKPYINFDMAHAVFVMGSNVLDTIGDLFAKQTRIDPSDVCNGYWNGEAKTKTLELLRSCKVKYSPGNGKTMTGVITDILGSVSKQTFNWKDPQGGKSKLMSVHEFYLTQYGRKLKHKHGLCLQLRGLKYVPAELCTIQKGQSYNRKLDGGQTTGMLKLAKKNPDQLKLFIEKNKKSLFREEEKPSVRVRERELLNAFGVSQPKEMLPLEDTRVLDAPKLCYGPNSQGQKAIMEPNEGVWDIWSQEFQFYRNAIIKKMAVYSIDPYADDKAIMDLIRLFQEFAGKRFMTFPSPDQIVIEQNNLWENQHFHNVELFTKQFRQIQNKFQVSPDDEKFCFILVILPKKGSKFYDQLKQAAELNMGILTQCIAGPNLSDKSRIRSIVGNIMLKLNSKMGGVNHVPVFPNTFKAVDILRYPVLILGADVTHPPPGSGVRASFAAITGSLDRTGMPYMMKIQAQMKAEKGAAEVIPNLEEVVLKMIREFRRCAGHAPVKIFYFRDGVGEGQFKELLHVELRQIRAACTQLSDEYKPMITFVTVQKRHRTRFFLEDNDRISEKNCPPGTIVDMEIVHPNQCDFYLLSHRGLLGTSRPSRYHVLWDDSNFKIEEIQGLAYFLCYMFVRCNRSVKIPAPTYYAHWAAQRAKVLTEQQVDPIDDAQWNSNCQQHINDLNAVLTGANLLRIIKDRPMFFV